MFDSLEIGWLVGLWLLLVLGVMLVCTGIVKLARSWFRKGDDHEAEWNASQTGLFDKNKRYRFVLGGPQTVSQPNLTEVSNVRVIGRKRAGELSSYGASWIYVGEHVGGEKVYIPCHLVSYFEEMKRADSHA